MKVRNAENKYRELKCGRCGSFIEFLPGDKPDQCPDCEWRGHPWGGKAKNPYDVPSDIKIPVPYSGVASSL